MRKWLIQFRLSNLGWSLKKIHRSIRVLGISLLSSCPWVVSDVSPGYRGSRKLAFCMHSLGFLPPSISKWKLSVRKPSVFDVPAHVAGGRIVCYCQISHCGVFYSDVFLVLHNEVLLQLVTPCKSYQNFTLCFLYINFWDVKFGEIATCITNLKIHRSKIYCPPLAAISVYT